jgi:hypothetical protein
LIGLLSVALSREKWGCNVDLVSCFDGIRRNKNILNREKWGCSEDLVSCFGGIRKIKYTRQREMGM